jgi:hypothetical protein
LRKNSSPAEILPGIEQHLNPMNPIRIKWKEHLPRSTEKNIDGFYLPENDQAKQAVNYECRRLSSKRRNRRVSSEDVAGAGVLCSRSGMKLFAQAQPLAKKTARLIK